MDKLNNHHDLNEDSRWTQALPDGLVLRATERPDSPLLDHFFAGYERAFVLPDECEGIDGFRSCLALNEVSRHRFGRLHRELVMVINCHATGQLYGGANFLATRMADVPVGYPAVTVALNYLFVDAAVRRRGFASTLKTLVCSLANAALDLTADAMPPALFLELNDPLRLSDEEYAKDTLHAGIDPVERLTFWARLGGRLVDFPYIQPALSAHKECDDSLALAAINLTGDAVDAGYLAAHLESYFAISVLKGGDPNTNLTAISQQAAIARAAAKNQAISLLPMQPAIDTLRASSTRPQNLTLREFARAHGLSAQK